MSIYFRPFFLHALIIIECGNNVTFRGLGGAVYRVNTILMRETETP